MSRRTTGRPPQGASTTRGEGTRAAERATSGAPPVDHGRPLPTHGATATRGWSPRPFRRHHQFWARIPQRTGRSPQRPLGTTEPAAARAICAWLGELRATRQWVVLDAVAVGRARAMDGYARSLTGASLEEWVRAAGIAAPSPAVAHAAIASSTDADLREPSPDDPDIEVLVETAFVAWLKARGVMSWAEYVGRLRRLIPRGRPFWLRDFNRRTIAAWLEDGKGASFNRYRTVVSQFGEFLVEKDMLASNPVRGIKRRKENAPRIWYLLPEEVDAVLAAIADAEYRAYHALLIATGVDAGAVVPMRWRDVVDDGTKVTIQVHGTKHAWRSGLRRLLHPVAGPVATAWLRAHRGAAHDAVFSFGGARGRRAVIKQAIRTPGEVLQAALWVLAPPDAPRRRVSKPKLSPADRAALELWEDYTQRDHRHTFAVQALEDGESLQVVSEQLGHEDTTLTHRVYGRRGGRRRREAAAAE